MHSSAMYKKTTQFVKNICIFKHNLTLSKCILYIIRSLELSCRMYGRAQLKMDNFTNKGKTHMYSHGHKLDT